MVSSQHYRSTEVNLAVPLSVASGDNKSAQNLEWEWLTSQGTVSAFSVNDKWHEYLDLQLVPPDNLTQRQRSWRHGVMASWLRGLGHTQTHINDQWLALYEAGLPV